MHLYSDTNLRDVCMISATRFTCSDNFRMWTIGNPSSQLPQNLFGDLFQVYEPGADRWRSRSDSFYRDHSWPPRTLQSPTRRAPHQCAAHLVCSAKLRARSVAWNLPDANLPRLCVWWWSWAEKTHPESASLCDRRENRRIENHRIQTSGNCLRHNGMSISDLLEEYGDGCHCSEREFVGDGGDRCNNFWVRLGVLLVPVFRHSPERCSKYGEAILDSSRDAFVLGELVRGSGCLWRNDGGVLGSVERGFWGAGEIGQWSDKWAPDGGDGRRKGWNTFGNLRHHRRNSTQLWRWEITTSLPHNQLGFDVSADFLPRQLNQDDWCE